MSAFGSSGSRRSSGNQGVDASQRFLTLVAQPYPWRLAARVAKLVATAYGVRDQATEFEA